MGIKIFYIFGGLSPDGSLSFYDDESVLPISSRYKLFICDTSADLAGRVGDLAVIKDSKKFLFRRDSQWDEIIGEQGPPGEQGIQGLPGNDGATGNQGQQGEKGDTGDQGSQGIQGLPGEDGLQGIQGIQGDQGSVGSQGAQGDQGIQGEQGISGAQGVKGDTGDQGAQGIQGIQGPQGDVGPTGYTINVQALTSSPGDGATVYFGQQPRVPGAVGLSKIYIRKAGTIKIANILCQSGTAGTAEAWSLYIRKNNSADTLIATLSVSASERVFSNVALNISVAVGDYIEIKSVQPTWATNPLTTIYGGYLYIE